MANALINSQIFFWLGGLLSVLAIAALLIPFRKYYFGDWNAKRASIIGVGIGVCIVIFSAWTTAFLSPTNVTDKVFVIRWVIVSLSLLVLYFLALCLITLKRGGARGYNLSVIILATLVGSLFLLTFFRSNGILSPLVSSVIFCSMYASAVLATIFYNAFSPSAEAPVVKDFFIRDTLPQGNGQKVKVILLNGQSNAEGVSRVAYLKKYASEEEFMRYTSGYENVMINYFNYNGATSSGGAFEYLSAGEGGDVKRAFYGPELGLADALSRRYPDEKIFIIKYAWGGSDLHTQWLSPSSDGRTGELYKAFVNFTRGCLDYLKKKNYDPKIYVMCWMQGESDAFGVYAAPYAKRSENLICDVRKEFSDYASDKGIWFLDAGISDSPYWPLYKVVNEGKKKNAESVGKYIYLDTIAAGLEYDKEPADCPDKAHYDSMSMLKLGTMFADETIKVIESD